jgi:tetratricopeptide (TPR) repeat protein
LAIGLVAVIGLAAWKIGLWSWAGWQRQQFDQAMANRDFETARDALANCIWLAPNEAELHLLAARLARRQNDLNEARRQLRFCRMEDTLAGQVGLEHRLIQIQSGDFAESEVVDDYATTNRDSAEARLIVEAQIVGSLTALDVARARKYLADWDQGRHAPADQAQAAIWHGTAGVLAGESQQALTHFLRALKIDPQHRQARLAAAELLTDSDPQQAAEHLSVLRQVNPADEQVIYQQALVERNLVRLEAAAEMLEELLSIAPEHVEGLVARGRIALDGDRLDEAGQWLKRAEAIEPKHRAVMLAMVDYLRAAGRPAEAAAYEQRMAEIAAELKSHVERVLDERRKSEAAGVAPLPHGANNR